MSVPRKKNNKDETWYYVFDGPPHPDGRRNRIKRRGFATRNEALKAEREHMRKFDNMPRNANGQTVSEFINHIWLKKLPTLGYKRTMVRSYMRDVQLHIIPRLGHIRLLDLDAAKIDDFYESLATPGANLRSKTPKPLSGKTIANIHGTLSKVLSYAVRQNMMSYNPCKGAVKLKASSPEIVPLRWDEVPAFIAFWADQPEGPAIEFALQTGLRRGEVLGLSWEHVYLDRARINIKKTLLAVDYEVYEDEPKTSNSKRWVPLTPRAVEILREQQARGTGCHLVFTAPDGKPFHPDLFSQRFTNRMKHWSGTKINVHGLRHTFATISLTRMGVKLEALSVILGHHSVAFTADTYTHWLPDDLDAAMAGWSTAITNLPPVTVMVEETIQRLTPERLREAVIGATSRKMVVERLGLATSSKSYARVVAMAEREGIVLPKATSGRKPKAA
jgi:integrase